MVLALKKANNDGTLNFSLYLCITNKRQLIKD